MKRVLAFIIALVIGFAGGFVVAKTMAKTDKGSYDLEILSRHI